MAETAVLRQFLRHQRREGPAQNGPKRRFCGGFGAASAARNPAKMV
jgi:hypothetical protein